MKYTISLNLVIGLLLSVLWMPASQATNFGSHKSQTATLSVVISPNDDSDCEDLCGGCDED